MILVTGATGMVGSYLVLQLAKENKPVVAMYRDILRIEQTRKLFQIDKCESLFETVIWKKADILDIPSLEEAFDGIETVIHCAAFISFLPKDKKKLLKVNIEGTANVVNCCIDFKVKNLIHISSIAALGSELDEKKPITEESPWNSEKPRNYYAFSKRMAEIEVFRGEQEGLQVSILNPGVIFGNHFPENESVFFEKLLQKRISFYTDCIISVTTVHDVVKAVIFCLENKLHDQFILVSENIKLITVLKTIEAKRNYSSTYYEIKKWQFRLVQLFDFLTSLVPFVQRKLNRTSFSTAFSKSIHDGTKINKLGFEYEDFKSVF